MIIEFTIRGNQDDPAGNPLGKIRLTGNQSWRPEAQRYAAWKLHVQRALQPHLVAAAADLPRDYASRPNIRNPRRPGKPIAAADGCRLETRIYFAGEAHADPEGVFGGIADAIFAQDKHLSGEFLCYHAEDGKGRVEARIEIPTT
jgi:hypothetical protein